MSAAMVCLMPRRRECYIETRHFFSSLKRPNLRISPRTSRLIASSSAATNPIVYARCKQPRSSGGAQRNEHMRLTHLAIAAAAFTAIGISSATLAQTYHYEGVAPPTSTGAVPGYTPYVTPRATTPTTGADAAERSEHAVTPSAGASRYVPSPGGASGMGLRAPAMTAPGAAGVGSRLGVQRSGAPGQLQPRAR